ncbi:MAG: AraC family transcriptional regulator [Lachnospiraceae bacterium]|nr:AraC family transcriptional regulator [Lachnospiraceae bacterium]
MGISLCDTHTNEQGKELTPHGTTAFPVACYMDDLGSMSVPWHWHEELEFVIVAKGIMSVSLNGSSLSVKEGEGIFINRGALHQMQKGGDSSCLLHSLVFHGRLVGGSMDSIFWQNYLEPLLSDACFPFCILNHNRKWQKEALLAAERAWISCSEEKAGYEFSVRNSLSELAYLLYANRPLIGQKRPSPKVLRENERLKQMLHYIHEHSAEELSVLQIAKSALISESECLRCFKNIIGTTPIRYVRQYRLQKAAGLLASSDEPVAAIAISCGFQEMSYFAKAFKKVYSMTPSAWRNTHRRSSSPPTPSSSKISL